MCWNGFAVTALDDSGVHTTGEKTGTTIVENVQMDNKEMALGMEITMDMDVVAFFQVGLKLESADSERQRRADGTRWRR